MKLPQLEPLEEQSWASSAIDFIKNLFTNPEAPSLQVAMAPFKVMKIASKAWEIKVLE